MAKNKPFDRLNPRSIHFKQIGRRRALLKKNVIFYTGIAGYDVKTDHVCMNKSGLLIVFADYEWDYGTFAIDTPDMVLASLAHDALCDLHNKLNLDSSFRKQGDKFFRDYLKYLNTSFARRWWCYLAVRMNSILFA